MKRFWLFAFSTYYPGGGLNDLKGTFETYAEAEQQLKTATATEESCFENYQIYDSQHNRVMACNDKVTRLQNRLDEVAQGMIDPIYR